METNTNKFNTHAITVVHVPGLREIYENSLEVTIVAEEGDDSVSIPTTVSRAR